MQYALTNWKMQFTGPIQRKLITGSAMFNELKKTIGQQIQEKRGSFSRTNTNVASDCPGRTMVEPLASPDIYCTTGDGKGEVDIQWDPVEGAQGYLIELSEERPFHWRVIDTAPVSKFTVRNLASGTKYWFRVCAMNVNGNSSWSLPILKQAP